MNVIMIDQTRAVLTRKARAQYRQENRNMAKFLCTLGIVLICAYCFSHWFVV